MRKIALVLLMIATTVYAWTASFGLVQAQSSAPCPTAPAPRLAVVIGAQGQVTPGLPNVIRSQPAQGSSSLILGLIPAGGVFDLIDGPICANGMNWWLVNYNGVIGWTPEAAPTGGIDWLAPITCSALPARLAVGYQGWVTPGLPNVIRVLPGTGDIIGQIPAGGVFTVFAGPQCVNGIVWWQVNYNGVVGWTGESQGSSYWVEPYSTTPPPSTCYGAPPPHMLIGMTGIVQPGMPQNVRAQPTLNSPASDLLDAGRTFNVLSGPVCADGLNWWQINVLGVVGWTAEGQNGVYWIDTVTCPGSLPSRMVSGDFGWVTPGLPNVLRTQPGTGAIVGQLQPYDQFIISGGPVCANGIIWWQVEYNWLSDNRVVGWTAEGQNGDYWLAPGQYVSIQN